MDLLKNSIRRVGFTKRHLCALPRRKRESCWIVYWRCVCWEVGGFLSWLSLFPAYLSCSNCRWPKADPERNHFSACVHASLPQATHPEGKTPPVSLAPEHLPLALSWLLICGATENMEMVHAPSAVDSFHSWKRLRLD